MTTDSLVDTVTDDDDNETSTDGCADDRGGEGVR
jgi:hypothetical protein